MYSKILQFDWADAFVQSNVQNKEDFRLEGQPLVSFKSAWPQVHLVEELSFFMNCHNVTTTTSNNSASILTMPFNIQPHATLLGRNIH